MLRIVTALVLFASANAVTVTVDNASPRLDNTGAIMDAHDCSIRVLPNGTYVMHTIEYGLCVAPAKLGCDKTADQCGFRATHNITVWTSPDLTSGSWRKVGDAFPLASRPQGLIFRPDAIFNPNTNLWVLFYNQASDGNVYISSTSPSPYGPFTGFATTNITSSGGDFHLLVDGADGYIVFTEMDKGAGLDHKIHIRRLTPDFLSATADAPYVFNDNAPSTTFNEAPSVFKRSSTGVWYALFGHCCVSGMGGVCKKRGGGGEWRGVRGAEHPTS